MEAVKRIMEQLSERSGPASVEQVEAMEQKWKVHLHDDLKTLYMNYGWGGGFAAKCVDDESLPEYLVIFSPETVCDFYTADFPKGYVIIGSNGASEYIVASKNGQFGLLDSISTSVDDILVVGKDIEEFFTKAETGNWFE